MTVTITVLIVLIVGFVIGWIFGQRDAVKIDKDRNVYDEIRKVAAERNELQDENEILQDKVDKLNFLLSKYDKPVRTNYHSPKPPKYKPTENN